MYKLASRGMQRKHRVAAPLPTGGYIGESSPVEQDYIPSADNMDEAECLSERRQLMLEIAKAQNQMIASKSAGDKEAITGLGHRLQGYAARLGMLKRRLHILRSTNLMQAFCDATKQILDADTLERIYERQQHLLAHPQPPSTTNGEG